MDPHGKESYCAFLFDEPEYYEEFMREILEAVQKGRANTHMLNNLGVMRWELGELEEAMDCFDQAIVMDPLNAIAFKNLGMLAERQGNAQGALPAFQEAVRLKPDDYGINLNNAYLLLTLGRGCEAIPFFEKAIALGFDNEIVRKNLAKAQALCGQSRTDKTTLAAPGKSTRRMYVLWAIALALLLTLGAFCWLVVVPVWQVRRVLEDHEVGKPSPGYLLPTLPEEPYLVSIFDPDRVFDELGGRQEAFAKLRLYLRAPNGITPKRPVVVLLLGYHGRNAVPLLIEQLDHEDPWIRELAAHALGRIGSEAGAAAPRLRDMANDSTEDVRVVAAEALKKIKSAQKKDQK
jgi:tetratricopeptide (TPR) repeat protein